MTGLALPFDVAVLAGTTFAVGFLLVAIAFAGGVGIATIGPGGVFVTIALYTLTAYPTSAIAGTTSATFLAGGLLGTAVYGSSGEIADAEGRITAVAVSVPSGVGAFVGSQLNVLVSDRLFGLCLAALLVCTSLLVAYRELRGFQPLVVVDPGSRSGQLLLAGIGVGVGLPSGLLGVGGPIVAVPALVLTGVPLLRAVATAQLLSVFVTGAATGGYLLRGAVDPTLLALVAPTLLAGVVVGWRLAHRVEEAPLRRALAVVLFVVASYLLLVRV